jgi:hypothetical protein
MCPSGAAEACPEELVLEGFSEEEPHAEIAQTDRSASTSARARIGELYLAIT